MLLRNKRSGKLHDVKIKTFYRWVKFEWTNNNFRIIDEYKSLKEIYNEWEDANGEQERVGRKTNQTGTDSSDNR